MSVGYLTYRPGDMIPVNEELLNKFEIYRDNRSQAQTIRDILCVALGVQLSKIDLSYGHVQKINTRIEMALEKERSKRGISKRETVRQLVSEHLESRCGIQNYVCYIPLDLIGVALAHYFISGLICMG